MEAWPARVPDLYAGEPLVLVARLGAHPHAAMGVAGRREGQVWQAGLPVDASLAETGIHRLWARKKITGLMDRLREGGDREEVRTAVVAVALRHRLVSAYTSLVAVDVTPARPADAALRDGPRADQPARRRRAREDLREAAPDGDADGALPGAGAGVPGDGAGDAPLGGGVAR